MDDIKWFKFNPSRWMMGKIQRCDEVTQARFIRLCSLYWSKDCEMTIEDAIIEIEENHFDILKSKKIITIDITKIYISFLDEQIFEIKEDKKDKSTSGIVGNLKRWHKDIYEQFLSKKISLEKAIELSKVIALPSQPDNTPIATQSQNIADKEETRLDLDKEETRLEKETIESVSDLKNPTSPQLKIDYDKLKLFFNDNCGSMAKVQILSDKRKKGISALIKKFSKQDFQKVIEKSKESNFLQGQNDRGWKADFDWILNQTNFIKILEGNFDNDKKQKENGKQQQFANSTKKPARFSVARATETLRADAERKQREMENRNS